MTLLWPSPPHIQSSIFSDFTYQTHPVHLCFATVIAQVLIILPLDSYHNLQIWDPSIPSPMLLLLSHFSRPTLCDPIDGSPPGLSIPGILQARTLEWVAISFSNAQSESESEVAQSCPTLCDPIDGSPPGSSIHGIFQARVLEWVAIAFSGLTYRSSEKSLCKRKISSYHSPS